MRVFLTGATGFIGSAIAQELIRTGHQVLGLARTDAGAAKLEAAGIAVHRGTLEDTESLQKGAAVADGVIHTAFIHDFSKHQANVETDKVAITAMIDTLEGSNKPFVIASGLLGLHPGQLVTETFTPDGAPGSRTATEVLLREAANRGIRSSIIRLSPTVHGDGDQGFIPMIIKTARDKGVSMYIGEGQNHWPAVHRLDAATLFRLALEKGKAGATYHGAADEAIPFRDIAELIGKKLNIPVVSRTAAEAIELLGFIGGALSLDAQASSKITREELGWEPVHPGLIEDLEKGTYF